MDSEPAAEFSAESLIVYEQPNRTLEIAVGEKTLIIPPEVQQQIKILDTFARDRDIVAEVVGFGLTESSNGRVRVVEIITPREDGVFVIDSPYLNQYQNRLMDLLAGSDTLEMRVGSDEVVIVPDGTSDEEKWLRLFSEEEDLAWELLREHLESLIGFDLPKDVGNLASLLKERSQTNLGIRKVDGDLVLSLRTDWDLIVAGGNMFSTSKFGRRVRQRAKELGVEVGFSTHHHPHLFLAQVALEGKGERKAREYYNI